MLENREAKLIIANRTSSTHKSTSQSDLIVNLGSMIEREPKYAITLKEHSKSIILGSNSSTSINSKRKKQKTKEIKFSNETTTKWRIICLLLTCCIPSPILVYFGMANKRVQHAWREKVALCIIIFFISLFVGLITFGFQQLICDNTTNQLNSIHQGSLTRNQIIIHGTFKLSDKPFPDVGTKDLSFLFQKVTRNKQSHCKNIMSTKATSEENLEDNGIDFRYFPCTPIELSKNKSDIQGSINSNQCHNTIQFEKIIKPIADVYFTWDDVVDKRNKLIVFSGSVLDLDRLKWLVGDVDMSKTVANLLDPKLPYLGQDVSLFLNSRYPEVGKCLIDLIRVGRIDTKTIGCISSNIVLYISLIVIIDVVLVKFCLAVFFSWVLSWNLGRLDENSLKDRFKKMDQLESWAEESQISINKASTNLSNNSWENKLNTRLDFNITYSILLVTCYSENLQGLKTTLDSLANTRYPNTHKLLFVVCDGIITGAGNDKSTPDYCLSLIDELILSEEQVEPRTYCSIGEGEKRMNRAKVYAGYYYGANGVSNKVPIILVVKCGNTTELNKPGNRGKRDSQMILMSFLQKVLLNDRMSELDFELFNAIWTITKVSADVFETVLMVDADTTVYSDSLIRMVACFSRDSNIMGLCGETKIANKNDSWVTMIQVFEYYISHHLSKAFESIFGGVTCLPGCFSMYRIKAPKYNERNEKVWIPILVTPSIINQYSECEVNNLHSKNLLLLGEDRFLTTLMLRTFPKRKLIFVPQAVCKTIVPNEFKVLLSQRRRWINSTVHNLLELVITRDLCGIFCFSMQFVIFMELLGTLVLPAAIMFTFYLIGYAFMDPSNSLIPLLLLALIIGLPAILILLTTRKIIYTMWMLIYLLSLPIWNFVLPLYAFWHFDDFTWGTTRQLADPDSLLDSKEKHDIVVIDKENLIKQKRWREFEKEKIMRAKTIMKDNSTKEQVDLSSLGYFSPFAYKYLSDFFNNTLNSSSLLTRNSNPISVAVSTSNDERSDMPWRNSANLSSLNVGSKNSSNFGNKTPSNVSNKSPLSIPVSIKTRSFQE